MDVFSEYNIEISNHEDYGKRPKQDILWEELDKTLNKLENSSLYKGFKQFDLLYRVLGTLRFSKGASCPDITTSMKDGQVTFEVLFIIEPFFDFETSNYWPGFSLKIYVNNKGTVKLERSLKEYHCYDSRTGEKRETPWKIPDPWPIDVYDEKEYPRDEIRVEKTFLTFSPSLFVKYL